ncbi:MAG: hypothetical protein NTZ39_05675 [Methanoregula sp.]|nr:hypothetical protein [Methanoregula sp.]
MKQIQRDYVFLAVLAAVVFGVTAWGGLPIWYLNLILLCLFGGIFYAVRSWHDRAFYLACAGVPLIIACCVMSTWMGLVSVWMVAGIVCNAMGILEISDDIRIFILFCGATVPVALVVQVSNHVVLPLLIFVAGTAVILAVQAVRDHQFRKQYGAHP